MDVIPAVRFERKYLVSERKAASIRDFVRDHTHPDPFNESPDRGYAVCSVYLDDSLLSLYRQTVLGHKNRFKLRVRYYTSDRDAPAFFEIKRRENDAIRKSRVAAAREGVHLVLGGHHLKGDHLLAWQDLDKSQQVMKEFYELRDRLAAKPRTLVCYRRQAFISSYHNDVRVTFDRQLGARRFLPEAGLAIPQNLRPAGMQAVILELKFTDRFPHWMAELVRTFDLQRVSVPKYIKCTEAISGRPSGRFLPVATRIV